MVSIAVDPESPESIIQRHKRRNWVNEMPIHTLGENAAMCMTCGNQADDPHHLIGHGLGGMGTKSHDMFPLFRCVGSHNNDYMPE